jgi:hypothetical protein
MVDSKKKIPVAVAALVNQTLSGSHQTLDALFREAGAPGDPPDLSHASKWKTWLLRANENPTVDPHQVLGKLLEEFMEVGPDGGDDPIDLFGTKFKSTRQEWRDKKARIEEALALHGLKYLPGGKISGSFESTPIDSIRKALASADLQAVDVEFERTMQSVDQDPAAAITAGCSMLEALFREYLGSRGIEEPSKLTLKPLWKTVQKDIGFDPSAQTDQDLQRILSGLTSIVDGIAALRTHGGSAHGGGKYRYSMKPRHARLLVNSAHTVAAFVLETWAGKKLKKNAG